MNMTRIHIMPRGGKREGSGPKPTWKSGRTRTIRVPEVLADQILDIARLLDEGSLEQSSRSACLINLSSVNIPTIRNRKFVFIEDLIKLGYAVEPVSLAESVRHQSLKP
jgi:hypothetical protein